METLDHACLLLETGDAYGLSCASLLIAIFGVALTYDQAEILGLILSPSQQHILRQLVEKLESPGLDQSRCDEMLDQMRRLSETDDSKIENMSSGSANTKER
jgi:hypothetical protein